MFTRTNGLIGTVVGLIIALFGVVALVAFSGGHHLRWIVIMVVGIVVLAFGIFAYVTSNKAKGAAA